MEMSKNVELFLNLVPGHEADAALMLGDLPGHPFRGNQYGEGNVHSAPDTGGGNGGKLQSTSDRALGPQQAPPAPHRRPAERSGARAAVRRAEAAVAAQYNEEGRQRESLQRARESARRLTRVSGERHEVHSYGRGERRVTAAVTADEHEKMRIRTMDDDALARRINKITKPDKLRRFVAALEDENKHHLARAAMARLRTLQLGHDIPIEYQDGCWVLGGLAGASVGHGGAVGAGWDEGLHPRDAGGQFAPKGSDAASSSGEARASGKEINTAHQQELQTGKPRITVTNGDHIEQPNSSGQGQSPQHGNHPFGEVLAKHGYQYSHSTVVKKPDGEFYLHHTFKHTQHKDENVGVSEGKFSISRGGSGVHYTGSDPAKLDKKLKGRLKRLGRQP